MATNDSNKLPYLLAAGAVGGAVGYLFLTKSGRRVRDSIFNMEIANVIPDKIEDVRRFIERRGNEVTTHVRSVFDHVNTALEEGKRAYGEVGVELHNRMNKLDRTNAEVIANIHRAFDNLNATIYTFERSVLEPIYEAGAVVRGVDRGVRHLIGKGDRQGRHAEAIQHENTTPFYRDPRRRMG